MSSENDPTVPVPTTGPAAPTAPIRRSATGGPSADPPTTPLPHAGPRHTDDPTLTLRTAEDVRPQAADRPADGPAGGPAGGPVGGPAGGAAGATGRPASAPAAAAGATAAGVTTAALEDRPDERRDRPDAPVGSSTTTSGHEVAAADTSMSRPPLRVGTVVWGLVLAVIGAGIIAVASGAQIDVELALIALLALAGVGLVVGSVVTGVRRRH